MPTYRNDGDTTVQIENVDGSRVPVMPGATVETHRIYDIANLTQIAQAPRYNPVVAVSAIEAGGAGDVTVPIHDLADTVEVINKSSEDLELFFGAAENEPGAPVPADTIRTFSGVRRLAAALIVRTGGAVSAGEVHVVQSR